MDGKKQTEAADSRKSDQFRKEVFPAELDEILERRRAAGLPFRHVAPELQEAGRGPSKSSSGSPASEKFVRHAWRATLRHVSELYAQMFGGRDQAKKAIKPSAKRGLVGLALSGGGFALRRLIWGCCRFLRSVRFCGRWIISRRFRAGGISGPL